MKKKVLIFTKRVLPRSNTFVASQGTNLPTIKPIFIGFRPDVSGIELIKGFDFCTLEEHEKHPTLSKFLLEGLGHIPINWRSALLAQKASIIHAHFGKGGYYCSALSKKLGIPLITTFHGSDITQKDKFSYSKRHRKVVFDHSEKIIAVSNFIKNKLLQRGCPEHKIIQHYIGIDTKYFSPSGKKHELPTILFVGRLIEQKGCQYLLEAMKSINKNLPEAQLIIAGDGNYRKKLEIAASKIQNVTFLGAQTKAQVKQLMNKAWLVCLPSIIMKRGNEEGMSMVCMEAQAMGSPVVAFDTGGVKESVIHNSTGLLVPEKDSQALAEALLMLLTSHSTRNLFSHRGIERIAEHFDVVKQSQKLEAIYMGIIR